MKKTFFTLLLLVFSVAALAQDDLTTEFKMSLGDTVVWKPFENCDMIGYSIVGPKVISFNYLHYGEKIQIIAKQVGKSSIKATCNSDNTHAVADITVFDPNVVPVIVEKPVKPATQAFTGSFSFNPPKDHFFITVTDRGTGFNETHMKLGDDEAYNDGQGIDRFWNVKTGKQWYYRPEAQGWSPEPDWEFEAFGESFAPLNAFANEVDKGNLSNYYVGTEKLTVGTSEKPSDINCWKFFVDFEDGTVIQYWVDPANGCTLQRQVNADQPKEVTVYDLKYTRLYFGPKFKKGLHDITR